MKDCLSSKWDVTNYPGHIFIPRGMLSLDEVMMLYDIAKLLYTREGEIVNAGAFIGASAYALAAGMSDNELNTRDRKVHSYDLFVAGDASVVDFLQNNIFHRRNRYGKSVCDIIKIELGFDYSDVYAFQTQRYSRYLETYSGDVKLHKWTSGAIEVLFIDVCKTLEINSFIFENFFSSLIPGVSIIVQQDFHHIYHPYIHVTLQAIKNHLMLMSSKVGASRVYRYVDHVPEELMKKVINYDFDLLERIELFNNLINESPSAEKPLLHVAFVNELKKSGEEDLMKEEIRKIMSLYDNNFKKAFWYHELGKIAPSI